MTPQYLTPEEFTQQANENKSALIDLLSGHLLGYAVELAGAKAEYYKVWLTDKQDQRVPALRARMESLEVLHKSLVHSISGLQSTLRADRIGAE